MKRQSENILLLQEVKELVSSTKQQATVVVNATLTHFYWQFGQCIHQEVLGGERAEYGKQDVATLPKEHTSKFSRGWSHLKQRITMAATLQRKFYAQMCRLQRWSMLKLTSRIDSAHYQRTALSKQPAGLIPQELVSLSQQDKLSTELLLKDPYVLDFLGLNDHYLEKDLEDAILRDLENFLLELGAVFTLVARHKCIQVAEYLTELLERQLLHERLQRAIDAAQKQYATGPEPGRKLDNQK